MEKGYEGSSIPKGLETSSRAQKTRKYNSNKYVCTNKYFIIVTIFEVLIENGLGKRYISHERSC